MNQDEQYYTPSIEEFHVGFEFQMKNSSDPVHFEWEHMRIVGVEDAEMSGSPMDFDFSQIRSELRDGGIRVKFLDVYDLIDLGWESDWEDEEDRRSFIGDFMLYKHKDGSIEIKKSFTFEKRGGKWTSYDVLFQGRIKNKSELKRLMQQLEIA